MKDLEMATKNTKSTKMPGALFLCALCVLCGHPLRAADAPPPVVNSGPTVQLPPMLVEESVTGVPWLYVSAGGTEFLSRCSQGITRELVEAGRHMKVTLHDHVIVGAKGHTSLRSEGLI